jgi:hypothetical protein
MPEKYPGISSTRVQIPGYLLALWVGRGRGRRREREREYSRTPRMPETSMRALASLIVRRLAAAR